ncbi:lipocalin-like domain-containing protein [Photobacterium sp. 53610]|uniref:lipocalin-like domain-containing protein n=1 Tax=Photobacterium sp. 53610 TaxID=3102789 RepID=UPI002ED9BEF2
MEISKEVLVGVWSLDEFIVHRESGELFHWPGKQNGTLIYTDNGFVSVAQNREPLPNPTEEDKKRESNFYTATYELDLANNRVFHTGLQSSVQSVIGERMEREIKLLEDGRLWLSGKGLKERVTLVWSKVNK